MDFFQQFSSYIFGAGQQQQQVAFTQNHTSASKMSLLNPLPQSLNHVSMVSINTAAFNALSGEWSHDSLVVPFHSFTSDSEHIKRDLETIKAASFISFDNDPQAFLSVIGDTAKVNKIHSFAAPDKDHVHEAPIYLPLTNELLFADTSVIGWLWALDIDTSAIRKIKTSPPLPNVNGGTLRCITAGSCTIYLTTNGGTSRGIYASPIPSNFSTSKTDTDTTLDCKVIINNFRSRHLNSPNDLIFTKSGDILFTDPDYGWLQSWPGVDAPELPNAVYHYSITSSAITVLSAGLIKMPNGLALSPDESTLYVADSASTQGKPLGFDTTAVRGVWAFDFEFAGPGHRRATNPRLIHLVESGWPDGLRVTETGLLMVAVIGGVDVVDPRSGRLLGKINVGDDVIFNLEPVKKSHGGNKEGGVWLLTGKTGVYRVEIREKGYFA